MLLGAVLAGLALALAAENVAAKTPSGIEYSTLPTGDMKVFVKDEGTTGVHLKPHLSKKSGLSPVKKEQTGVKAAVKDEGATGAHLKEPTGNGVPPLKHISFANNDKIHKKQDKHDESPDFEDTPLVAAASSQSSRINVKKGPNGQEYEYEYVYYYYDDEDEDGKGGAKTDKPAVGKTERPDIQDEEPSPSPRQEAKAHIRDQDKEEDIRQISRQELRDEPKDVRQDSFRKDAKQDLRDEKRTKDTRESYRQDDDRQDLRYEGRQSSRSEGRIRDRQGLEESRGGFEPREEEPARHRGGDAHEERRQEGRGRTRGQQQQDARPEEDRRRRPVEDNAAPARSRYTTIERGRGKPSDIAVTTVEPSSNEVVPTRTPSRGRTPAEVLEEERLPSNTRFPGRSRGSTTAEPPPSRSRGSASGGGGSVRRPSLVDSSSFRTHSSDAAPEEDQGGYLSSDVADTRESDLEEYIRPTTFQPQSVPQTTLPPPQPSNVPQENDQDMPAKAALDLYAILQQTQEENSVVDSDYGTTNVPTTDPPTTTPEPTTTPTTTTTTTTTTTPPPPPEPTKRGRFRTGGSRTRVRSQGGSTTTTTEAAPEDEASQRPKFKPSHSRSPGQVSAYGRRRAGGATSTTTEAPQQSTRARNNFQSGSNGNRYRTRGRVSTTPAPVVEEEEPSEEVESTSTTAKPRVRIGATAGARPLRPGPRLNLRPLRPGAASTTAAPAPSSSEAPVEQEVATTPEPPAHSEGDALTKLRSRPRLKVQPVVPQTRPFNNQRRPLIGLNNRRRTTESEVSAETTTQPAQVETETPPPSSTEQQPHTTENKLASLIGRRRPLNRRLPLQQAGDH